MVRQHTDGDRPKGVTALKAQHLTVGNVELDVVHGSRVQTVTECKGFDYDDYICKRLTD